MSPAVQPMGVIAQGRIGAGSRDPHGDDVEAAPEPRRNLALLASIRSSDPGDSAAAACFGNILELGCEALLLEADREQRLGAALALRVVFPGQRRRANPVVTLHCVIRRVRDAARLLYDATIENLDDDSRQAVVEYLSRPRPQEEG
jgi:hypothetical protein